MTKDDVQVELYQGAIDANGEIVNGEPVVMENQGTDSNSLNQYSAEVAYHTSGLQGLSLRVLPKHPHLSSSYEPRLIVWAQ